MKKVVMSCHQLIFCPRRGWFQVFVFVLPSRLSSPPHNDNRCTGTVSIACDVAFPALRPRSRSSNQDPTAASSFHPNMPRGRSSDGCFSPGDPEVPQWTRGGGNGADSSSSGIIYKYAALPGRRSEMTSTGPNYIFVNAVLPPALYPPPSSPTLPPGYRR